MYICCRKYYKSSEVTDSYNSSDVVRDLVAALQNYSQSPDTCKSLNEGPVMYDRCIRHFSDTFSLKCHSFLLWQAAMHCIFECLIDLLYTWCCFDVSYTCYNNHHLLHNHRCCSVEKFCVYSIRHRQVIFFMFFCRFLNVSRLACKPRAVQLISSSGSRIDSSEKRTRIQNSPFYSSFRNMTSRIL